MKYLKSGVLFFGTVILGLTLLSMPQSALGTPQWGPWPERTQRMQRQVSLTDPAGWLFHMYQKHLSSEDGASCPFYPTCSAYAYQALKRHGLFYGSLLALDRLFSEYPNMPNSGLYPLITKHGIHRPYDPVP